MNAGKKIYLLIGPKGSGKTFIGNLISTRLDIPMLRMEDLSINLKKDQQYSDKEYVQEIFRAIEEAARKKLSLFNELVFDSIGLTESFDNMLASLKKDFTVRLIRIKASPDVCLYRVKNRAPIAHVNMTEARVAEINEAVEKKAFAFDGEITNDQASLEDILRQFSVLRDQ